MHGSGNTRPACDLYVATAAAGHVLDCLVQVCACLLAHASPQAKPEICVTCTRALITLTPACAPQVLPAPLSPTLSEALRRAIADELCGEFTDGPGGAGRVAQSIAERLGR